MIRIRVFAIALCLTLFSSCSKENLPIQKWAIGSWCLIDDEYTHGVRWYWELSSDGRFIYWDLDGEWIHTDTVGARYVEGTLYVPEGHAFKQSLEGKYYLEGNKLYINEIVYATLTKLSADTGHMDSDILSDGTVGRIKRIVKE